MTSGKWYCEFVWNLDTGGSAAAFGIVTKDTDPDTDYVGRDSTSYGYRQDAIKMNNASNSSYGATWVVGDIISVAYDADIGSLTFYKNGVSQGVAFSSLSGDFFFGASDVDNNTNRSGDYIANFGQDSSFAGNKTPQGNQDSNGIGDFYYAPPSGFLALCTQNLPDATVIPSEHFNTVLWTGNGSTQSITGVGFQPDFTWVKSRDTAWSHSLQDILRPTVSGDSLPRLLSNSTAAESINSGMVSFGSDGFSLNADANFTNANLDTFVAWNWKAGGSASSNSNGSITSSVSANAAAGFSILTYTGTGALAATIGHGLAQKPELIIRKDRGAVTSWVVNSTVLGTGNMNLALILNTTAATDAALGWMNNTAPTSTVFTQGSQSWVGVNGRNYIAYAFHSVDGYSKVGSYTGDGLVSGATGTFVFCGFRPAFILIKAAGLVRGWQLQDSKRSVFNGQGSRLEPNSSGAESTNSTTHVIDFLSNGFKLRHQDNDINAQNQEYIFYAIAETPFKFSNAR